MHCLTIQVNVGELVDRVVDEYTYAELVPDRGERLKTHWDTFLTRWPGGWVGWTGVLLLQQNGGNLV